jgi:hypothetical protein
MITPLASIDTELKEFFDFFLKSVCIMCCDFQLISPTAEVDEWLWCKLSGNSPESILIFKIFPQWFLPIIQIF